jgi:hypothetical protein
MVTSSTCSSCLETLTRVLAIETMHYMRLLNFATLALCSVVMLGSVNAGAQKRIALKSGESVELHPVYWVANCRSIMIGLPDVEVLEGPPELVQSIKEEMALPRRQNCANRVNGGTLVVTAKDIKEPGEARLAYRLKYKTKDGERVRGNVFRVSLYP